MEKQGRDGSLGRLKPYLAAMFLQVGLAGMDILSKSALNQGMSNYALVVYRHAIATLVMAPFAAILDKYNLSFFIKHMFDFSGEKTDMESNFCLDRKVRPKMTLPIFIKIVVLGLME